MRTWLYAALIATGVAGTAAVVTAMGCGTSDCSFDSTCGPAYTESKDGGPIQLPPGCNAGDDPTVNANCVDQSVGVFVSSKGLPTGDGSKAKPFGSFEAAMGSLSGSRPWLFVCTGSYNTNLVLDGATESDSVGVVPGVGQDGGPSQHIAGAVKKGLTDIAIYGGFDCDTWGRAAVRSQIQAKDPDVPGLWLNKLNSAIVTDLNIKMDPANGPGASSIAVFVGSSKGVVFKRVTFQAGAGQPGASGSVGDPPGAAQPGQTGSGNFGGAGGQGTCGDVSTSGGKGGDIGNVGAPGSPTTLDGGAGGPAVQCDPAGGKGLGGNGAQGRAGNDGSSASALGLLSASGWKGQDGDNGAPGSPGQGGGGGGGGAPGAPQSGGGGGGGAGGCGGAGGPGGQAGGSSIALASYQSFISVFSGRLGTDQAANGGAGSAGQGGQAGGSFGNGASGGCLGGRGGQGGSGGAGGGGAGGLSVGVLYFGQQLGMAPTLDSNTQVSVSGKVGAGGKNGNTALGDGKGGISQAKFALPSPDGGTN